MEHLHLYLSLRPATLPRLVQEGAGTDTDVPNHTGGGVERPKQQVKPHGTALQPGLHITHDVDACRTAEGQHQLEVRWH